MLMVLLAVLAHPAAAQVALRSVTQARSVAVTHGAPARTQEEQTHEPAAPVSYDASTVPAAAGANRTVRYKTAPSDPVKDRAAAMFSKVLLAFNDKEHGKRIMAQRGPSYHLDDWFYFPVRIKSLTSRKVEDQVIMVNPATGKYRLEVARAAVEGG